MGGVENGAAEEDWLWDLNPGVAAMRHLFWDHVAWAEKNPGLFGIMHLLGPQGLGREEPQTSISFSEIGTRDWEEREGRTVHLWVF